ncbi:aminoglycoside 3'-phosphotransferase [Kocuria rhizophila]|uniref:aminoglycoside 3'-phosphotransferase n=1 Tax=Kocuria rhizophila TaxID=72000 RepID=UPI00073DA928|nr:aminoglycoside 3'-phosphotransferase [Kocuria rhizophila]
MGVPSDLAGPPPVSPALPDLLRRALAAFGLSETGASSVWQNGVGGLTFAVASGGPGSPADVYAKWNPPGPGESLADEAERMRWIQGRHPAPTVVELVADGGEEVLLTQVLPGESAVSARWREHPNTALQALGAGLRELHDVAVDDCPFAWDIDSRIRLAGADARVLGDAPDVDRLVLCQGDPCAPNTLPARDGSFLAHVDLGRLGVADRWADLSVMSMSLAWNCRAYDESVFWRAYGVEPDPQRIGYYRELWNLA